MTPEPTRSARPRLALALLAAAALAAGCPSAKPQGPPSTTDPSVLPGAGTGSGTGSGRAAEPPARRGAPVQGYEVVAQYPHDARAYTQGLFIADGTLFESTGRHGTSSLRIVDLATGAVKDRTDLDAAYFGEGIAPYKGLVVMLTWREGKAFVFDRKRLTPQYEYSYTGEGWGLTFDGAHFWMSDGTHELRVIDPAGFKEVRRVAVTDDGRSIGNLNELEWIEGELWANVWQTDRIVRIDPESGKVNAWVDLRGILGSHRVRDPRDEVLNGIAWDAAQRKLYVTGKHWPWLYEIRVRE